MPWYFSCKSHWFCGLVQIHPQDVVVFILNTATESGWLSPWDPPLQWGKVRKRIYRPATHPIYFAADSPRQNHRCAAWAVFFFSGNLSGQSPSILLCKTVPLLKKPLGLSLLRYACKRKPYLENFISRPNVIPTFRQRRCTNRGRNFVRSKRWPHYMSSGTLYLFLRLNNSETFVENAFWAQR